MNCWGTLTLAVASAVAGWAVGSKQWSKGVHVRDRTLAHNQAFLRELKRLIHRYR
jgi:hypothetical protein